MSGFDQTTPVVVGRTFAGRYRLVAPIARGGMAEVWEGYDEILSRAVALKVLQSHLASDGVFLERFRREAVTAARLAHPGIVSTFDTGLDDGTAYIVMELVRGRNLRQLISDDGRLPPPQALEVTRQLADALAYAHRSGLVHRDVKPANVLLVEDHHRIVQAKVTDFGIAKAGASMAGNLTRTGMVLGTPKYLSPEQIRGRDPDARADLYSLGVVLYEMLSGAPPFAGDSEMATAMAHLDSPVPRLSDRMPDVAAGIDRLVSDLLAKDPDHRVPSASDLQRRLEHLNNGSSPDSAGLHGRGSAEVEGMPGRTSSAGDPTVVSWEPGAADRTVAQGPRPSGPTTDELALAGSSPPTIADRLRRSEKALGMVVLSLVLVGVIVAAVLASTGSHRLRRSGSSAPLQPTSGARITSASVYMSVSGYSLDDAADARLAIDGNPSTYWHTDQYHSPTFGNLYPGIGLELVLSRTATLHTLTVTSPTQGWSGQAYASNNDVQSGQPLSAWGAPADSKSSVLGSTTFNLGAATGRYVLLWLTNLGPARQAIVDEVSVG